MSDQPVVIKKKVKPYPFEGTLEINAQKTPIELMYLNTKGAIIRLKKQILHVGEYYQVAFEIPVSHVFINTQVRVLKTYDKALDIKEKTVERLAELHFQELTKEHRSRIVVFMNTIGQKND